MRNLRREAFTGTLGTSLTVWHAVNRHRAELAQLAAMTAIERRQLRWTAEFFRDLVEGICRPHPILIENLGIQLERVEPSVQNLTITSVITENGDEVITSIQAPPGWEDEEKKSLLASVLTRFEESKPYVNFILLDHVVPKLKHFLETERRISI